MLVVTISRPNLYTNLLDLLLQEISIEKVHILHQNGYKANRVASNNFNYSEFDSIWFDLIQLIYNNEYFRHKLLTWTINKEVNPQTLIKYLNSTLQKIGTSRCQIWSFFVLFKSCWICPIFVKSAHFIPPNSFQICTFFNKNGLNCYLSPCREPF